MIPTIDIGQVAGEPRGYTHELTRVFAEGAHVGELDPRRKADALERSLDELHDRGPEPFTLPGESGPAGEEVAIGAIGDRTFDLLSRLSALAGRLGRPQTAREIEGLALPIACSMARHGGEIYHLPPVVNAAAAPGQPFKGTKSAEASL
jgi:hypothetical protein